MLATYKKQNDPRKKETILAKTINDNYPRKDYWTNNTRKEFYKIDPRKDLKMV